ncbi:hypothetical protein VTG60DRAFT_2989 [Thermothelomyces hinnuleus]
MAFEQGPPLRPFRDDGRDGCGDGEHGEREEKEEEEKEEEKEKKEEEKKEEEKKEEEKKEEEKKEEEKKEKEKKEEEKKEKEEERGTQETESADMVPLRAALAHLCDVALPWLALNEGFVETLMTEWMPGLWMNVVSDAIWFGAQGVLDEMWAVLEEAIAPREDKTAAPGAGLVGDGAEDGDGERGRPTSGSKKRRRNAEEEGEQEELQSPGGFEIWRDGHPGEPATPPRWRRPQRRDETDDRMINGERLSPEQQREVAKENLLAPTERGAGGPPRGGVGRGMLQRRHNFTDPGLHSSGHDSDGNEARGGRGDDWDVVRDTAGDAMSHNGADRVMRNMALLR